MNEVHFDFAVLLTVLTLVTGLGWLLDKLFLARRRRSLIGERANEPSWPIEICRSFFPVIAVVLVLRSFIAEPFRIPSGSMIPTLRVGDFILVNKFAYGLRDPVFHYRFLGDSRPQRGDIAVFRFPQDPSVDYIKRIVAVPGDTVAYRNKVLYINGVAASQQPEGVYALPGQGQRHRLIENLSGVEHAIIVNPELRGGDVPEFILPAGQYFGMGDNRDGSSDSRVWGTIPEANLVGRAFMIWMSWDGEKHRPVLSRIGTKVK